MERVVILTPGSRVVLIGDSHMEALGPRLARTLPDLGVRVLDVVDRRGWSARSFARTGEVPALTRGANVVIFELGGNDAAAHITAVEHQRDVKALLQQAAPAQVIWIGPGVTTRADMEAYRHPIRGVQKSTVRAAGGAWIDSQRLTRASDLRRDGVHYTMSGYDRWASLLKDKLAKAAVPSAGRLPAWVGPVAFAGMALGAAALIAKRWRR